VRAAVTWEMAPESESGTLTQVRQAHLILVTGLPGTGKSTLARALASRYRVPIVAKDTIKEPLLDVIGAADRAASRNLSDASFAVMFSLARACLAAGTDLLLEGNFRPGEHESAVEALIVESARARIWLEPPRQSVTVTRRADGSGRDEARDPRLDSVRIAQILCHATETVRLGRLTMRATDPTRHPGHRDADLAAGDPAAGDPAAAVSTPLDFLALPGERLVFDSDARSAAEVDTSRLQRLFDTLDHWHGPTA
jgi:predicted kinase